MSKKINKKSRVNKWFAGIVVGIIGIGTALVASSASAEEFDIVKEAKKAVTVAENMGMETWCESITVVVEDIPQPEDETVFGETNIDPDDNGLVDECRIVVDETVHNGDEQELKDTIIHEVSHAFTLHKDEDGHGRVWLKAYIALCEAMHHTPRSL